MSMGIPITEEVFDDDIGPGADKPEDVLSMAQEEAKEEE